MKKYKKISSTDGFNCSSQHVGFGCRHRHYRYFAIIGAKMPFSIFMTIIMSALPTVSSVPTTILPVKKQLLSSTI